MAFANRVGQATEPSVITKTLRIQLGSESRPPCRIELHRNKDHRYFDNCDRAIPKRRYPTIAQWRRFAVHKLAGERYELTSGEEKAGSLSHVIIVRSNWIELQR